VNWKGWLMRLFGNDIHDAPVADQQDRQIKILSARLATEALGLRRARVQLRTQLMQEILDGPEHPQNDIH
jgi:hypothetical protein